MRRPALLAAAALLLPLLVAACGQDTAPPAPVPDAAPTAVAQPAATGHPDSSYGRDRVLKRTGADLFGAPVPDKPHTAFAAPGVAALTPSHSYNDLLQFYKKELARTHIVDEARGGARFSPRSPGDTVVYVTKPRRLGQPARVTYFNGDGSDLPEALKPKPNPDPTQQPLARGDNPGAPKGSPTRPGDSPTSQPANYRQRTERDAQGREVVVWQPTDAPAAEDPRRNPERPQARRSTGVFRFKDSSLRRRL